MPARTCSPRISLSHGARMFVGDLPAAPEAATRAVLIDVAGARCNVIDEGDGPPVLWLHGLGGTWRDFGTQIDRLADRVRCIVPELRGHGRTPPVPGPFTTAVLGDDVALVLDVLGVDRAVVVGLSLGGMVAQAVALDYPERVAGLVLVSTSAAVPRLKGLVLRAAAARVRARGIPGATDLLRLLERHSSGPSADDPMRSARADGTAWERRDLASNDPDVLVAGLQALVAHDERSRLGSITVPTMVVVGEHDPAVSVAEAAELAAAIPGAVLQVVEGGGHLPNRDHATQFDALVMSLVDRAWRHSG